MSSRGRRPRSWIAAWLILSVLPLLPYAEPLAGQALADTPLAYLVWIPPLGFLWAVWVLADQPSYNDDLETNLILGVGLLFIVGLVLATGPTIWPYSFVGQSLGLLLWPLWALGMAWLLFGVGVTPRLLLPLLYLALAWPPLLAAVVAKVQGALTAVAVEGVHALARSAPWIASGAGGSFLVEHAGHWHPILVSAVCSGADSLLAVAIVLPVVLTRFRGPVWRKGLLVAISGVLALLLNLVRLGLLVLAVHLVGSSFAFDVLHPMLGFVLFLLLVGAEVLGAVILGLRPAGQGLSFQNLRGPGRATALAAVAAGTLVSASLLPLTFARASLPGTPLLVASFSLRRLVPVLPGFRRVLLGRFDDASILGKGSRSVAYAYSTSKGAYVLLQVWMTPNLGVLESYAYQNCLAYHGDRIAATGEFVVRPGVAAQTYAVRLPAAAVGQEGPAVADAEWTLAIMSGGRIRYLRVAASAPAESAGYWPKPFLRPVATPSGVLSWTTSPSQGVWPQSLTVSRAALARFAVAWQEAFSRAGQP